MSQLPDRTLSRVRQSVFDLQSARESAGQAARALQDKQATAVVYCEANFGKIDGKTANGLVRHSELYRVLSVIDSTLVGSDTGVVLDGVPNGIPIHKDLADAIEKAEQVPQWYIFGMAPASGRLSTHERALVLEAIERGLNIVNGLHEFLNDDEEFANASARMNVRILDIRRPNTERTLHTFSGRIHEITCPRIAVLGTDCAIGKRTTATVLAAALTERGLDVVMIGTGQTGLMQGARYGIARDAVPSQFCAGELEAEIIDAFEREQPDVIIVEGQGALSHPAYSTSSFILRGSCPDAVILQHAPARKHRCDFPMMPMPKPVDEIKLIQTFSDTRVIGLTINHESMSDSEVDMSIERYEEELGIPVTDALKRPAEQLAAMVFTAFPELESANFDPATPAIAT